MAALVVDETWNDMQEDVVDTEVGAEVVEESDICAYCEKCPSKTTKLLP